LAKEVQNCVRDQARATYQQLPIFLENWCHLQLMR